MQTLIELMVVPAGRYARSLRLILSRARKAKVIPANSTVASAATSPKPAPLQHPGSVPVFPNSQQMAYPMPTPPAISPNSMLLSQAGQIISDSPSSGGDALEFDALFARETLERAGIPLGEGDSLPLYVSESVE